MKRTLCNKCNPKGITEVETHYSECGNSMKPLVEFEEECIENKCKSLFRFIKLVTWLIIFSALYFLIHLKN